MKHSHRTLGVFIVALIFSSQLVAQSPMVLNVKVDKPAVEIQPTMWGIFFEDINFAADGGLYAELIKNRSFEFFQPLMGWKEQKTSRYSLNKQSGSALIINRSSEEGYESNPRFARVTLQSPQGYILTNEGFRGMGIKKDMEYHFSLIARQGEGSDIKLRIELADAKGNIISTTALNSFTTDWKKYTTSFKATQTDPKAVLNISIEGKGSIDLDMISLFPNDTWKNRSNGLRNDLVQLLADMKPGFLRFPGGCIVEGRELATRYQWKKTVGNVEDRELIVNRWNTEFNHKLTPDYFQSFGLGFYEYFLLAEDIGAEPLPIISCGMACQFNSAEVTPMEELDPYIQDALDLIEFANGSIESPWGKVRTAMGHPKPFNLKLIGVGNEQWGPQYIERYKVFSTAIKAKYPDVKIVSGAGPFADGELFDYASAELKALNAEIIDEHYYNKPQWFYQNVKRYDLYDRKGPKIFAGEYAAQSVSGANPNNKNTWECALAEAAFMTGLERNADMVHLASYAPLFAHAEGWQWTPDLIWFDNLRAYGTPNYYVQKLFASNKGTHVLPISYNNEPVTGQEQLYATAAWDKNTKEIILKVVNASDQIRNTEIVLQGGNKLTATGKLIVLGSVQKDAVNSLEEPQSISPKEQVINVKGKKIILSLTPASLTVLRVKTM